MKASEAQKLVAVLKAAYPRQPIPPETTRLYAAQLVDLPADAVQQAVRDLIASSPYFPTLADIRKRVAELQLGAPSAWQAWEEVEQQCQAASRHEGGIWEPYRPRWSHPLVERAVKLMGGFWQLYDSQRLSIERAQFLRLYEQARSEAVQTAAQGRAAEIGSQQAKQIEPAVKPAGAWPAELTPRLKTIDGGTR
jgi:hypothetical protein